MAKRRALITGITSQDEPYLAELLLGKGYDVYGLVWQVSNDPHARIPEESKKKIKFIYGSLRDRGAVRRAIQEEWSDGVYNLATQSDGGFLLNVRRKRWISIIMVSVVS